MNPNDPRPRNLFPVLYEELRQLAQKKLDGLKLGNTLTPTALVHEAFVKMATYGQFSDPAHFYRCSALAMQQILVDQARMKIAEKRGGTYYHRVPLEENELETTSDPDTILAVDDALSQLAIEDPFAADLARMRLFAGFSVEEAGDKLGLSRATAFREWSFARAFLVAALKED